MRRVLITGSNRGLGLEFARQCLARGHRVFATCRTPSEATALHQLDEAHPNHLSVLALDVTDTGSIDASYEAVSAETDGLDWLVNNAGVNSDSAGVHHPDTYQYLGHLQAESLLRMLGINAVGPLLVAQRYLDLLKAGEEPRIINISSHMGSLTHRTSGGSFGYAASKAALNMFTRSLAAEVAGFGIVAVSINPGWVRTNMGGPSAPLKAEKSVGGILDVIDGLTAEDNGRFLRWDGAEMPW